MGAAMTDIPEDFKPDLEQARRFLKWLAGDNPVTFQTFDDDEKRKDPRLARIFHGTLDEHSRALTNLNNQRAGIFLMINRGDGKGRKAQNVIGVRAVFLDLDGSPLEPVLTAPIKPDLVVKSSPGRYHAYWKVTDCPLNDFRRLQKALADKFDGDHSVIDLCRVMRLPGYFHRKKEAVMTVIEG
jgi:hypothetical protein